MPLGCARAGIWGSAGLSKAKKLYTEGVEDVAWVEGFSSNGYDGGGSQSKEADHLYLYAWHSTDLGPATYAERTWVTDTKVNLTPYSTLKIDWEGVAPSNSDSYLVVSSVKDADRLTADAYISHSLAFARQTQELDISGLSGEYYIRVHAAANRSFTPQTTQTYKVWLE